MWQTKNNNNTDIIWHVRNHYTSINYDILTAEHFHLQQMCIESSTLLPPGDNELFTPMTVHAGKEPLKGCVLSIR